MSELANAAQKAAAAWSRLVAGRDVDAIRNARLALDAAENALAQEFAAMRLERSTMELQGWTVTIEAHQELTDLGMIPAFPLIMYHRHEKAPA